MTGCARRRASLVALALALAGCGSTVQSHSTLTPYGGQAGLDGQPAALGAAVTPGSGATLPGAQPLPGRGSTPIRGATVSTQPVTSSPSAWSHVPSEPRLPLTVGVVLTGTSNADSFGVKMGNTLSERDVDQAVIDGINAQGGVAGRKLVPVFAKTDTGSASWETDFGAACATFTQDHHVAVVLGYVFNYFASFESCLAKQGIPHLNTGFNIPDRQELSAYPLHLAVDVPTIDRRGLLKLDGAVAAGVLTRTSKLGVLTDTCPGTARSLNRTFLPETRRLGLTVTKTITVDCANGNSDSGKGVQAVQSAVLQFASSGVDHVIFHAVSEGPPLLLFALSAESQGYRPTYLVSSLATLEVVKQYIPPRQLPHIHGFGWMANLDVPPTAYPAPNASQQRCLGLLKAKGLKPTTGPDYAYAYNFCEAAFLYRRALEKTGGVSAGAQVMAAIRGFGTDVESAINNDGSAFGPQLDDAVRATRHLVYRAGCSCFAYAGPTRRVPAA
jgi:hypothetical protein